MEILKETIYLLFIGISVVFLSFFLLQMAILIIEKIDRLLNRKRKDEKISESEQDQEELIAVIAAAVNETMGKECKIYTISIPEEEEEWISSGRYEVLHSHNLKK